MKSNKIDALVGRIAVTAMALLMVIGIPYLVQTTHQDSLERSMTKAITCIEKSCMNYKQLGEATKWHEGELNYTAMGKEHLTTLGNADFYRVKVAEDTYLFRVDGSKHLVMQYFKLDEDVSEKDLIAKYDIY